MFDLRIVCGLFFVFFLKRVLLLAHGAAKIGVGRGNCAYICKSVSFAS